MNPWICPRCETVWAGWVAKYTCKPVLTQSTATVYIKVGTGARPIRLK